jgi:hypothetical protein
VPSPFLQARVSRDTRDRAEQAAQDCEVPLGTWLREVIEDALDAHFDVELVESETLPEVFYEVRSRLGLCSCPGFTNHGHCKHLSLKEEDAEPDEDYLARLDAEAAELRSEVMPAVVRVQHPGEVLAPAAEAPPDSPQLLNPRDCPHHPAWVKGGRCRCGTSVGRRSGMMRR